MCTGVVGKGRERRDGRESRLNRNREVTNWEERKSQEGRVQGVEKVRDRKCRERKGEEAK